LQSMVKFERTLWPVTCSLIFADPPLVCIMTVKHN
jgi:hypothetical protein